MQVFCRAGYLAALLKDDSQFPECLKPYLRQLQAFFDPEPSADRPAPLSDPRPLSKELLLQLVSRLNYCKYDNRLWLPSDKWCELCSEEAILYSPVVCDAYFDKQIKHADVFFSTFEHNQKNGIIHAITKKDKKVLFGKIISIFTHHRRPIPGQPIVSDTWVSLDCFRPAPMDMSNPFWAINEPDMQSHLFRYASGDRQLIHISEIVAHCSWVIYKKGEINTKLNFTTIALGSLQR